MSQLHEITQFNTEEFGLLCHTAVILDNERASLIDRDMHGVVARFGGSLATAQAHAEAYQEAHDQQIAQHYGITNKAGYFIGLASVNFQPMLRRLRLPIWPNLSVPPIHQNYHNAGAEISAWVRQKELHEIVPIYRSLREIAQLRKVSGPNSTPGITWALEGNLTLVEVFNGLTDSGMRRVRSGRFDNGDELLGRRIPPVRSLFVEHGPVRPIAEQHRAIRLPATEAPGSIVRPYGDMPCSGF